MKQLRFTESIEGITPEALEGFFVGWPHPPTPSTHLRLLQRSTHRLLAVEMESGKVVGYVTALADGVLFAYISSLEVLPAYQARGVGAELMKRMLESLRDTYAVDLVCDANLREFYARFGMQPASAMILRRYERQDGSTPEI